jgi:hypothetical protein
VEIFRQDSSVTEPQDISIISTPRVHWSVSTSAGYDNNVTTATSQSGSTFSQTNIAVSEDFHTARTRLNLSVGGGAVYYFDHSGGRSNNLTGNVDGLFSHQISKRLGIVAKVDVAYLTEPDFASDLGSVRRQNYFRTSDSFLISYKWSHRLSMDGSYEFRLINYEDSITSADQDRIEQSFGESVRYRWSPRLTTVGEYRFSLIEYDISPRDSTTHSIRAGIDYRFNTRLTTTLRGGITAREYQNDQNGRRTDPYASASLDYVLGPKAHLTWNARYSIEEPNTADALNRTTFRTGLQLQYEASKRLTPRLAVNYYHDENNGLMVLGTKSARGQDFSDDGFELVLGVRYEISHCLTFDLAFAHSAFESDGPQESYYRNRYSGGLTLHY